MEWSRSSNSDPPKIGGDTVLAGGPRERQKHCSPTHCLIAHHPCLPAMQWQASPISSSDEPSETQPSSFLQQRRELGGWGVLAVSQSMFDGYQSQLSGSNIQYSTQQALFSLICSSYDFPPILQSSKISFKYKSCMIPLKCLNLKLPSFEIHENKIVKRCRKIMQI